MDQETFRKDYVSTQNKINDLAGQYRTLIMEMIPSKEFEIKRANMTTSELEGLPEDCNMYRACGKAYLKASKQDLLTNLKDMAKSSGEDLEKLNLRKSVVEKAVYELERQQEELAKIIA